MESERIFFMIKDEKVFTLKIGGSAGDGQLAAGTFFAKACARGNFSSFGYAEFPSLIRGGHVTFSMSVSEHPVRAIYQNVNLLVALNSETIEKHIHELTPDGVIVYNCSVIDERDIQVAHGQKRYLYPLPIQTLLQKNHLPKITSNLISMGAVFGLLQYPLDILLDTVSDIFKKKSAKVNKINQKAVETGYQYAKDYFSPQSYPYSLQVGHRQKKGKIFLTCNHAVALGALAAGCRVYVHYPMSPSSSILHTLAEWEDEAGICVYQPEDEIAGVHNMIGAMYAGARSMIATSGGGFALMTEALTLSAMTETPAVICVCSRPGPATGLPTWTEQGDLKFIVNAGHGDFPRVVLAPSNPQEAFSFTAHAFSLAEKYQLPVFILMDKYTSEGYQTYDDLDCRCTIERGKILSEKALARLQHYNRYKLVDDGVSPRALPGTKGGIHLANSDEHDEYGFAIEGWDGPMREKQMEKRAKKLQAAMQELPGPEIFGPPKARLTLMGWGSTKGPVLEALRYIKKVNYIHIPVPYPVDEEKIKKLLRRVRKLVIVENNYSGQFAKILRAETGIHPHSLLLKYDGRQFYPEEILSFIRKLL